MQAFVPIECDLYLIQRDVVLLSRCNAATEGRDILLPMQFCNPKDTLQSKRYAAIQTLCCNPKAMPRSKAMLQSKSYAAIQTLCCNPNAMLQSKSYAAIQKLCCYAATKCSEYNAIGNNPASGFSPRYYHEYRFESPQLIECACDTL